MNRLFNNILLAGLAIFAFSCVTPEDPTATKMSYGTWNVDEYYVDGQTEGSSVLNRFILERDGSFLLEDNNGIIFVGTWTATDTELTLTAEDETVFQYAIIFQSFSKMQLLQTLTLSSGTLEIRYLMNFSNTSQY